MLLAVKRKVVFTLDSYGFVLVNCQPHLGGYCSGVPPLPIPNREVKPACADGTAILCGRVGDCPLSIKKAFLSITTGRLLFLFYRADRTYMDYGAKIGGSPLPFFIIYE